MKIDKLDYSKSVVLINNFSRNLQKAAAHPDNQQQIYEIAWEIIVECSNIVEQLGPKSPLTKIVKRLLP